MSLCVFKNLFVCWVYPSGFSRPPCFPCRLGAWRCPSRLPLSALFCGVFCAFFFLLSFFWFCWLLVAFACSWLLVFPVWLGVCVVSSCSLPCWSCLGVCVPCLFFWRSWAWLVPVCLGFVLWLSFFFCFLRAFSVGSFVGVFRERLALPAPRGFWGWRLLCQWLPLSRCLT
jgi:hypothetical protein